MNEAKNAIRKILQDDDYLCGDEGILAVNRNPEDSDATPDRKFAIVDFKHLENMKPPFITIKADDETNIGRGPGLVLDAFIQVRCYNTRDKTFFDINGVLSRVRALLHETRLDLGDGNASVETRFELTRPELPEEQINLNFRESQYRTRYL